MQTLHLGQVPITFTISAYIFGFFIAPLSTVYGKVRLYRLCAVLWALFSALAAAAPNIWSLVALRFLAGCAGGTPMVLGSSTVADLFYNEVRSRALSFHRRRQRLGALLGPAAGGRIAQSVPGWRGCFVLLACVGGRHLQVWLYVNVPARYEEVYSFSAAEAGSVFILMGGGGVGTLVGLLACWTLSGRIIATCAARSVEARKEPGTFCR
ncbi:hypothetical protein MGG_09735 [Pyricularia oryzae 70-15]|uniref:Major facilitator superfamily (MFS) profile domain-containing protein n=1 Tax=Pyricularia oryzae (strain 70-15 / ATCC MYA-4617 / FGSC 8958) TaxID=242507 RepID=G4NAF8_PYRO7|nr:uncharacterized protein MGG_09735 [Pyricularia oryzae 70-15]EHA51296.1 hypothetical protein MGG_09735 [Pyricularia oryzae 70-15]